MQRRLSLFALAGLSLSASLGAADVRKPPAITTESVAPVPTELAERLRQYQDARSATFAGWSPDGAGMLVSTRFGNTAQLHRVYEPGGRREQITFFTEPAGGRFLPFSGVDKSPDLLATISAGGSENFQIYFVDRRTGKTTLLTDGKSRFGLGPVRKDGSRMIVSGNQRNGKDSDVYIGDPRSPNSLTMVYQATDESWQPADWSPDGYRVLMNRFVSINETYPAILDLITRKLTPLPLPDGRKGAFGDLRFSRDGKSAYLTTDARGEFHELARLKLATGEYKWLAPNLKGNVEEIALPEGGEAPFETTVFFTVNEDGVSRLHLLKNDVPAVVQTPEGVITNLAVRPKSSGYGSTMEVGFTFSSGGQPSEAYSIIVDAGGSSVREGFSSSSSSGGNSSSGFASSGWYVGTSKVSAPPLPGRVHRWTFSETGGLPPSSFVEPKLIQYATFDGRTIPAFIYKPTASKHPAPVVVMLHGGPEAQHRPTFGGFDQFLIHELGIAVVWPNVRGSDGYGKTYLTLDNGPKREDSVKDVGALLDWIKTQPDLDSNNIAVMGGSYGGYMVLASLTNFPERIKAGVDIVGIGNFITFLERTASYRRDLRRAEYGDERDQQMREVFERISPANHADRIKSALLVVHGKNDPRVPFFEAEQMAAKVRSLGRPVWTVFADNEGHGFQKKENRDYMNQVIAVFLKENLLTEHPAQ